MQELIPKSWESIVKKITEQPYFSSLGAFVNSEYQNNSCYPERNKIFEALKLCSPKDIKVVILGQDPYHGAGQAEGLSFSVPDGLKHPPSLINIFKEIQNDLNVAYPSSGNLRHWANQGVLLLNATLTVRAGEAGSHQRKGWEQFTDDLIKEISNTSEGIVFMLWGGYAKKKSKLIDGDKHLILNAGHPSPLSANRGYWFGNKHFSTCNSYLNSKGDKSIVW